MSSPLDRLFRRPYGSATCYQLDVIVRRMQPGAEFPLIAPSYQRGRVWTKDQQVSFIRFLILGGRCPALYIRQTLDTDYILDGLQRCHAINDFVTNGMVVDVDGERVTYAEATLTTQRLFRKISLSVILLDDFLDDSPESDRRAMELYLQINQTGTPHTEADLDLVRSAIKQFDSSNSKGA